MFKKYTSEDNWLVKCLAGAALAAFGFFFHLDGSVAENLGLSTPIAYTPALPAALVLGVTNSRYEAEAVHTDEGTVAAESDADTNQPQEGGVGEEVAETQFADSKENEATDGSKENEATEDPAPQQQYSNDEIDEMIDYLLDEIEYLRSQKSD